VLSEKSDLFILDDGFQHWQLYRDTDILVIDATNPFGNGRLIPFGILREPVEGIKRADIILINKCDKKGFLEETVRRYNKNAPLFYSTYRLEGLLSLNGEIRPVETIRNRNVFAFSGIASPAYFLDSLKATGTSIKGSISFIDHHKYSEGDILKIQKLSARHGADFILTTEKDMVKLREIPLAGELRGLLSLRISLEVNDSEFYNIIFGREGGKG
jgi:tetraacyldisaccharide 4'-kinase